MLPRVELSVSAAFVDYTRRKIAMSKRTRREFLGKTVFGALGAGLTLAAVKPGSLWAGSENDKRGYGAGRYAVELQGISAGWLQSVEGGHAVGDVVNEKLGADNLQKKHIGNVKYEDITLNCGAGMSKNFYEWIEASLDNKHQRKDGAIVTSDYDYKEMSRLEWTNGLISEVGLPALDASSKDAAKMTIKITPESTRMVNGSKKPVNAQKPSMQKKWLPANFRLRVDPLDCTKVNKIDAITVKQKVAENAVGTTRNSQTMPASMTISNLVITLPESSAQPWYKWHEEFAVKGNNSKTAEKSGQLEYLTEDLRDTLFTLTLKNLGIFKIGPDNSSSGGARRVKIEMYCESIHFSYGPAASA